jgi:hypothetical protein
MTMTMMMTTTMMTIMTTTRGSEVTTMTRVPKRSP